ncbi:MAG: transcription antitermination factor NusB [Clostridia bacterium]
MTRHELREFAFVLVFEQAVTKGSMQEIIDSAEELREVKVEKFAQTLALGVEANIEKIDEVINKFSRGWSVTRLSKVSAATLRLAVYELLFETKTPIGVSINEAVEIAKKYGDKDDASYVNGVLSSVSKDTDLMGNKINI